MKDQSLRLFGLKSTGFVTAFSDLMKSILKMFEIASDGILFYKVWLNTFESETLAMHVKNFSFLTLFTFA
jgi:hypothetical protein